MDAILHTFHSVEVYILSEEIQTEVHIIRQFIT